MTSLNNLYEITPLTVSADASQCINFNRIMKEINNIIKSNEEYQKSKRQMRIKQPLTTIIENNQLNELITIQDISSELDGLILQEQPNIEVLEKLLNSDLVQLSTNNNSNYDSDRQQLEEYKNIIDTNGIAKIKYNKQRDLKIGRVYATRNLSAINLRKEIRGSLFKNRYVDIDIVNSQPTIFYQISKILKINCPNLERYITNREDVLQEVQDHYNVNRDIAKDLFIRLLFHGSFSSWARDNQITKQQLNIIREITHELHIIGHEIVKQNPELKAKVERQDKNHNNKQWQINITTISYYAHAVENRILEQIYKYCIEHNLITNGNACLCYDGIMILKDKYTPELLTEFNQVIYNKYGLDLTFIEKPMPSYLDILDDHIIEPVVETVSNIDISVVYPIDYLDQNML